MIDRHGGPVSLEAVGLELASNVAQREWMAVAKELGYDKDRARQLFHQWYNSMKLQIKYCMKCNTGTVPTATKCANPKCNHTKFRHPKGGAK